jgi:hypothetical protein
MIWSISGRAELFDVRTYGVDVVVRPRMRDSTVGNTVYPLSGPPIYINYKKSIAAEYLDVDRVSQIRWPLVTVHIDKSEPEPGNNQRENKQSWKRRSRDSKQYP